MCLPTLSISSLKISCYEKLSGSLLADWNSTPDERMSGMENQPAKPLFIVLGCPVGT